MVSQTVVLGRNFAGAVVGILRPEAHIGVHDTMVCSYNTLTRRRGNLITK